ncbi:hypothetical protein JCM11641_001836 [Rhodosporidiobolus odoratus]
MAEKTLQQLRTNVERLGARLGENLAEHSRDLGLVDSFVTGTSGSAGKYLESGITLTPAGTEETKRLLGSKSERERGEGLKRVIAMMTRSLPVSTFFPLVTSLLSPTLTLQHRTLISLYIIHCSHHSPELALLAINAYQKDLSDPNPLVRAGAIGTLSQMGLPDIRELVGMAIQKGARDTSWYVRRATADAVRTLFLADSTSDNRASLLPTLQVLLDNATPLTLGAALTAWEAVALHKWEMLHQNYRKWCKMLVDVEEWGQVTLLRVLAKYGRTFFLDPAVTGRVDKDAELVLKGSEPLLQHLNPAVVSATITLHYYLAPATTHSRLIRPLLRLLHASAEVASSALTQCALIAEDRPELLSDHLEAFYVKFDESLEGKRARLRVLMACVGVGGGKEKRVLGELITYVNDTDEAFSRDAISAIGTCALRAPNAAGECLTALLRLLQSPHEATVSTSILVLRTLLTSPSYPSTPSRKSVITRLASFLHPAAPQDSAKGKSRSRLQDRGARATVYWLVGQYAGEGLLEGCGPEVVRLGAKGFKDEPTDAKLHLLTLAAKLLCLSHLSPLMPSLRPLSLMFSYLTTLARYDLSYPVRDRARFLAGAVASGGIGKQAEGATRVELGEEEFKSEVSVEEMTGGGGREIDGGKQVLRAEEVRRILFEGKEAGGGEVRWPQPSSLGSLGLALPSKRFSSPLSIPPYSITVPPTSIRDPPLSSASSAPSSRSSTPLANLQGFGSDSFRASSVSLGARPGRTAPREQVVLTPTSSGFSSGYGRPQPQPKRRVGMEEFLADSSSEEEGEGEGNNTEDEEEGAEEEEGDASEEGEEGETGDEHSEEDGSDEESEGSGEEDLGQ